MEFVNDGLISAAWIGESELAMRLLLIEAWSLAAKDSCVRDRVSCPSF